MEQPPVWIGQSSLAAFVVFVLMAGCIGTPAPQIRLDYAPSSVPPGQEFSLTWHFPGAVVDDVGHAEVHYGFASDNLSQRAPALRLDEDPRPVCGEQIICGGFDHPTQQRANLEIAEEGTIYFIIHGVVRGQHVQTRVNETQIVRPSWW